MNKCVLYFIQAGDPILTYFPKWSVISLLRQPAGVGAGGLCAESNPAGESKVEVPAFFAQFKIGFFIYHCRYFFCSKVS
jgi:hypothetical protein